MKATEWFGGSKSGLAKIARRRGLAFVLFELVQNSWDTGAKIVHVSLKPVTGRPYVELTVTDDDPDGFKDLSHAWVLFAESEKKSNPEKRGFMNLGEKLVLAICDEARVHSTTGTVVFDGNGRRETKERRTEGTEFYGRIRMTREEYQEVVDAASLLLVPSTIVTVFNGERLPSRVPIASFEATLPTINSDNEGNVRPTRRKTNVSVYPPIKGVARLYEMGIPVVEIDLPWSVDIAQKVPVNADRDNVTPAYKRELAVLVLNEMHDRLEKDDAATPTITETLADQRLSPEAQSKILTLQFGEKRAIFDPTDVEAGHRLASEGYQIIPPTALPKGATKLLRSSGVLSTAREISPSYRPYSDDPAAPPANFIPEGDWTSAMKVVAQFTEELGRKVLNRGVKVQFEAGRMTSPWAANYGRGHLTFNYARLGKRYFEEGVTEPLIDLLIHEFSHEFGGHLTADFDDALSRVGARIWRLAMVEPEFFRKFSKGG